MMSLIGHSNFQLAPILLACAFSLLGSCAKEDCESQDGATVRNDYTALPLATNYQHPSTSELSLEKTSDSTYVLSYQKGDSLIQIEYSLTEEGTHENGRQIFH
jgi:hypothetical protein